MIKEQTLTSELLSYYDAKVNLEDMVKVVGLFFKSKATSEVAIENEHFKKADEYFERIKKFDCMETMIKVTRDCYYRSYKEDGILAGAANALMMLFFEFTRIDVKPSLVKRMIDNELTIGEIYMEYKRLNHSLSDLKKKFIKETSSIFDECIAVLGSVSEGKIFAEYYLALKYLLCMIDNSRTYRENLEIGKIMMLEFTRIGNPLAKEVVSVFGLE